MVFSLRSGQNLAGLFDGVFLKLAQINHRTRCSGVAALVLQVVAKVFKDGFHVHLVGGVGFAPELGGVEQIDQLVLEFARRLPLALVPARQLGDGQHARRVGGDQALRFAHLC
jgi:hypothetical protein